MRRPLSEVSVSPIGQVYPCHRYLHAGVMRVTEVTSPFGPHAWIRVRRQQQNTPPRFTGPIVGLGWVEVTQPEAVRDDETPPPWGSPPRFVRSRSTPLAVLPMTTFSLPPPFPAAIGAWDPGRVLGPLFPQSGSFPNPPPRRIRLPMNKYRRRHSAPDMCPITSNDSKENVWCRKRPGAPRRLHRPENCGGAVVRFLRGRTSLDRSTAVVLLELCPRMRICPTWGG